MRITVIGTGYVGLVTGVCLAAYGNEVVCVDTDSDKISNLNMMKPQIYEPGLEEMLADNFNAGRIKFTLSTAKALKDTEICFICVGTPLGEDGRADLNHVLSAARNIGQHIAGQLIVVNKSTVPVGTADLVTESIKKELALRGVDYAFEVVSNPEFLKEGAAISDFMRPDRIIIGTSSSGVQKKMHELYKPFILNTDNFIVMDIKSAEMTKYAANAMLATKISFMNELSNICERTGANINRVRKGLGSDSRIGYSFIYAGCGYGGSCFPKDVKALIKTGMENDYEPLILQAIETVNEQQKQIIPNKIVKKYGDDLFGYTFGVWGLSFKPDTDDMRYASSITIINELTCRGAKVKAYDPKATHQAQSIYLKDNDFVQYVEDKYEALKDADAMILITEWKEFRSPDFNEIKKMLKTPVIFDGRNQYDADSLKEIGFEYHQIGVPPVKWEPII